MVHRALLNHDVARDGVLPQVVTRGEMLDLLFLARFQLVAVLGLDVELGRSRGESGRAEHGAADDYEPRDIGASRHPSPPTPSERPPEPASASCSPSLWRQPARIVSLLGCHG